MIVAAMKRKAGGQRPTENVGGCGGGGSLDQVDVGVWGGASASQKFIWGLFVLNRFDWGRYKINGNPTVGWGGSGQADIGNRFRGDPWKSRCALSMSNVNKMWL